MLPDVGRAVDPAVRPREEEVRLEESLWTVLVLLHNSKLEA